MTPFLKQVAGHYFGLGDISGKCFIFPNRRSMSFFKKYLGEEVKASGVPVKAPHMYSINDFFFKLSGLEKADRTSLLLDLHNCYEKLAPQQESLDEFIFWGDVLLADFDDVDKYLVKAENLMQNVSEYRAMQDDFSYLTDTQRQAMESFLQHFHSPGEYKSNFVMIWDILFPLYTAFREKLASKGEAYEGMAYRAVAERLGQESVSDMLKVRFKDSVKFVFVGLNALNECEKSLLRKMRDARLAEFCWDYGGKMLRDPHNRSSFFLEENIMSFPQAFEPDAPEDGDAQKFSIISVPSSVGEAKLLPEILRRMSPDGNPGSLGIDTAIVLPDESMLIPVLNSIPAEVTRLNVTMGYPISASEIWSLLNDISSLQLHMRQKDGTWYFYHKQVWAIFSNSIFKTVAGEEGQAVIGRVKKGAKYYIPREELSGHPVFDLLFKPVATDLATSSSDNIKAICEYQQGILSAVACRLAEDKDMAVEMDFAKQLWLTIGGLRAKDLPIKPASYFRLLGQVCSSTAVPFQGEPLEGLQIMGPLETRALDFDNLVILNCNEGVFPRHNAGSSFIPPELRKGFSLPTYEYQDSVWAYYFYRMIRRASKVTMLFDSRTEGIRSGEESRYIKQLELHFGVRTERYVAKAAIEAPQGEGSIPKTPEDLDVLHGKNLSASALQNYLVCPAQFYFGTVKGLRADDEVSESLDAGMTGNVFHNTMEALYKDRPVISRAYLESLLKDRETIRGLVRANIMEQLHTFEISGRNIIFEGMICQYVEQVLKRDLSLLKSRGKQEFALLGIERWCRKDICGFHFVGKIDRLDSFSEGTVRVVDYKTGKVTDEDFLINEDNAGTVVANLFGNNNAKRPKIALQLYLYDLFTRDLDEAKGKSILNSIYQTSRLFVKEVEEVELNGTFCTLMKERLKVLLDTIADTSVPWERRREAKACEQCDFKTICGQ